MIATTISTTRQKVDPGPVPPLRDGDRMSQPEFHRRYLAMPEGIKAELIEGIVHMPPPVGPGHGDSHYCLNTVGGVYQAATPGVQGSDKATTILGPRSEPQPDFHMRLLPESGGKVHVRAGFLAGPPELVVEVADSSKTIDLNAKRRDYRRAGVLEYLVVLVSEQSIRAFGDAGEELTTDADGIYRSRVFPGLRFDPVAIVNGDTRKALRTLNRGLRSHQHAAFVKRLKASVKASAPTKPRGRRRT